MKEHRRRPARGMPFRNTPGSGKGGTVKATLRAAIVLIAVVSVGGGVVAYSVVSRELSVRAEASPVEEMLARAD